MRIISGKYKGKRILAPKNIKARPTTDFAKESLFNVLGNRIDMEDIDVLDLFGGTGNISFEFASRGATSVTCVDKEMASYQFINSFAHENGMPVKAVKSDVFKFLNKPKASYPLIFADPPYAMKNIPQLPELIFENNWLEKDGILVIEHGEETDLSKSIYFKEMKTYGRVHFSFFGHQD